MTGKPGGSKKGKAPQQQAQPQQAQTQSDDEDLNNEEQLNEDEEGNPGAQGTSEFVRKLFRMLEDKQIASVVCWAEAGDSFTIRDQNEFSKYVLPNHFKHNNFASFVRQLNKYDFHKVKTNDTKVKGSTELMWEFKHPNFSRNAPEQLAFIKRKNTKKLKEEASPKSAEELQSQVETLGNIQKDMASYLQTLSRNYESVVREVIMFKRNMAAQDQLIQNLLQYLVSKEVGKTESEQPSKKQQGAIEDQSAFQIPPINQPEGLQQQLNQHIQMIQQLQQLQQGSQPQSMGQDLHVLPSPPPPQHLNWQLPPEAISGNFENFQNVAQMSFAQMEELSKKAKPDSQLKSEEALTVHSVGMLRPRPEDQQNPSNSVRVIRKTFVPGWSVPPKVLVVEDDIASRQLASKFLQVMGCTYEVAQDGLEAVNKMNLSKYDLVLMDIVMPQMDGISATTQIRQFDSSTPVISMTSNTSREDCIEYLSNGMNDILPKPFSRDSLRAMLEHYCAHLKTNSELPRANVVDYDSNEPASKRARYSEIQSG